VGGTVAGLHHLLWHLPPHDTGHAPHIHRFDAGVNRHIGQRQRLRIVIRREDRDKGNKHRQHEQRATDPPGHRRPPTIRRPLSESKSQESAESRDTGKYQAALEGIVHQHPAQKGGKENGDPQQGYPPKTDTGPAPPPDPQAQAHQCHQGKQIIKDIHRLRRSDVDAAKQPPIRAAKSDKLAQKASKGQRLRPVAENLHKRIDRGRVAIEPPVADEPPAAYDRDGQNHK
jgi:hypothetical protein